MKDNNILSDHIIDSSGPLHSHSRLNFRHNFGDVIHSSSNDLSLHFLLDLFGSYMLFQLKSGDHCVQHDILLAISFPVASENSLDHVNRLVLNLPSDYSEGVVCGVTHNFSGNPQLSAPVDGSQVIDAFHHILSAFDSRVEKLSESMLLVNFFDTLCGFSFTLFTYLCFVLPNGIQKSFLSFFSSNFPDSLAFSTHKSFDLGYHDSLMF